jgi:hypothetical protein
MGVGGGLFAEKNGSLVRGVRGLEIYNPSVVNSGEFSALRR